MTAEQIVDAHHHLWELARFPYPWLLPSAPPRPFGDHGAIKRDYRIGDYLDDTAARVAASVHVQANAGATDPVAETRWVAQEAARSGRSIAIVGFADPLDPDLPRTLDRHMAVADFRGVRIFAGWDHSPGWTQTDDPHLLRTPALRRAADLLEQRDLSLDLVVFPAQMGHVAELAMAFPRLRIAVNHLAMPRTGVAGDAAIWRDGIGLLAPLANVFMKISGLWTIDRDWRPDVLGPYVGHVVGKLGPDRCMYGSNLPIEKLMTPMPTQVSRLVSALGDIPGEMRRLIFAGTAAGFYRLRVDG